MTALEHTDTVQNGEQQPRISPDIGEFAFNQFALSVGEAGRQGFSVEWTRTLEGQEAGEIGKQIFEKQQRHRHPFWYGNIDPVPCQPAIVRAHVFETTDTLRIQVSADYVKKEKTYTLPVTLKDTMYVFEDAEGHIYLFTDHTDSLMPSSSLYREMSRRKKINPDYALHELLTTYSHSAEYREGEDRKQFAGVMDAHHAKASAYGLAISTESFLKSFDTGYLSSRSPVHCYLSGVQGSDGQGELNTVGEMGLQFAIARMMHRPRIITPQEVSSLIVAQCETRQGVFDLLRYNVLPNGEDAIYLKTELGQMLVQLYLHPELRANSESSKQLAELTPSELSQFLLQLSSQLDQSRDARKHLASLDTTFFHQRAFVGLLHNMHAFGFENYSQVYELFTHIPLDKSEKKQFLRDLKLGIEAAEFKAKAAVPEVSYEVREWLGLGDQQKIISDTYGPRELSGHDVTRLSGGFLGRMMSSWRPRLAVPSNAERWVIPVLPFISKNSPGYGKPAWNVWIEYKPEFPRIIHDPRQITDVFTRMRQSIHNPFWRRQIDDAPHKLLDSFFDWAKKNIRTRVESVPLTHEYRSARRQEVAVEEAKRVIDITRYSDIAAYSRIGDEVENALRSVQFALQMEHVYADIKAAGYPVLPAPLPGRAFRLKRTYIPYHLAAYQADRLQELRSRIRYGLTEHRGHEGEHLGARILELLKQPDMPVRCSNFVYPKNGGKAVYTEWIFGAKSRQTVLTWARGYVDSGESTGGLYRAEGRIGNAFNTWIRGEIGSLWKQSLEAGTLSEKIQHLDTAIVYATALHDLNRAKISNYYAESMDQADKLAEFLTEVRDLFTNERISPFGDITLRRRHPVIFRGENMAGKSTVMRQLLYAALLQNQGLPQTGVTNIPFGLRVDTPIGSERQGVDKSLLSSAISGLHRIAGLGDSQGPDNSFLWSIDEMGRRTNKHFGETLFMTSVLLGSLVKHGSNYVVSSSHYHDLERFMPLFTALKLTPEWYSVRAHRLHRLHSGDLTESLAIASLRMYIPYQDLQLWPDTKDLELTAVTQKKTEYSDRTISRGRIEEITFADLFGSGREAIHNTVSSLLGGADYKTTEVFVKVFLNNIDDGKNAQKLFAQAATHSFQQHDETIRKVTSLLDFYSPDDGRPGIHEFKEAERILYQSMFGINAELPEAAWQRRANAALRRLNKSYSKSVRLLRTCMRQSGFDGYVVSGMQKQLTRAHLSDAGSAYKWKYQLAFARGVAAYTEKITRDTGTFHKVRYIRDPKIDMKDAFNPYIPVKKVVPNDVQLDFSDGLAGSFISGENYSGKSNYIRTVAIAIWLARTTGYAPAARIRMHPEILPLSLTQPVADEIGASSMAVEARERLRPALLASRGVKDSYIVTLLDEPGAPTSPEDAGKSIRWLYRNYAYNSGQSRLMVTSHCDDVPQLLAQDAIAVDMAAFRLLSETPFKKFAGSVDSNALEVARKLELDPLVYNFATVVHAYIRDVDGGVSTQESTEAHARQLTEILSRIEAKAALHNRR